MRRAGKFPVPAQSEGWVHRTTGLSSTLMVMVSPLATMYSVNHWLSLATSSPLSFRWYRLPVLRAVFSRVLPYTLAKLSGQARDGGFRIFFAFVFQRSIALVSRLVAH